MLADVPTETVPTQLRIHNRTGFNFSLQILPCIVIAEVLCFDELRHGYLRGAGPLMLLSKLPRHSMRPS